MSLVFHHVAYAVKNIEDSARGFENVGYFPVGATECFDAFGVLIQFLESADANAPRIELVSPARPDSIISEKVRVSHGISQPYHICFLVEDIEKGIVDLRERGFLPVSDVEHFEGMDGSAVCFLTSKSTGLIELIESKDGPSASDYDD